MTARIQPVHLISCVTIIVLDWLVYATTMGASGWWASAWYIASAVGSVCTLVLVAVSESRHGLAPRQALLRGLIAALAVAVPLPVIGTALGLAGVAWAMTASREQASG